MAQAGNTQTYSLLVATVLTVYGIETRKARAFFNSSRVATVLTVYGIETYIVCNWRVVTTVATVLTVYGIETMCSPLDQCNLVRCNSTYRLRY